MEEQAIWRKSSPTHKPVKALLLNAVPHAFLQEDEQLFCGCSVVVSKLRQLLSCKKHRQKDLGEHSCVTVAPAGKWTA